MRRIALFNGSESNSITLNILAKIARSKKRVLYVDLRSNLLNKDKNNIGLDISSFLNAKLNLEKHIVNLEENLDQIKGSLNLNLEEFNQFERFIKYHEFENSFKELNYDYIIFEVSPILSILNMNVLFASSEIMTYSNDQTFEFVYSLGSFLSQFNKLYGERKLLTKVITLYEDELNREKYARVVFDLTSRVVCYPILNDKKAKEFPISLGKIVESILFDEKDLGDLALRNKKIEHDYLLMLDRISQE